MKPPESAGSSAYLSAMISLAAAAFGVVAALAWNAAITELFKLIFPPASGIIGLFVYAIIVTIIAVVVMVNLANAAKRLSE
ncbi:MAG: DUF5654 family protein [Bacteroidetes bacterium]|nr:DUF5654 family protein [Bacteroidota bacterium]MCL5025984.1 DUF5654 family protein [Chloroflexota bacterium]